MVAGFYFTLSQAMSPLVYSPWLRTHYGSASCLAISTCLPKHHHTSLPYFLISHIRRVCFLASSLCYLGQAYGLQMVFWRFFIGTVVSWCLSAFDKSSPGEEYLRGWCWDTTSGKVNCDTRSRSLWSRRGGSKLKEMMILGLELEKSWNRRVAERFKTWWLQHLERSLGLTCDTTTVVDIPGPSQTWRIKNDRTTVARVRDITRCLSLIILLRYVLGVFPQPLGNHLTLRQDSARLLCRFLCMRLYELLMSIYCSQTRQSALIIFPMPTLRRDLMSLTSLVYALWEKLPSHQRNITTIK